MRVKLYGGAAINAGGYLELHGSGAYGKTHKKHFFVCVFCEFVLTQ